ncbi:sulfatase [Luteolibacter sp. SL250]|uniref:sulfatase n=1 Tax=Luteolibacter sp. SL250 TaxID=2995170 RepID=UPI002270E7B7|nr:sulfatase [Luteolibacter sp. SL250]WAC21118.1 sulfatase [Luteolibacter sp. SL250]
MKPLKFLILPLLLALQPLGAAEKPNILFIFTDDLGASDLVCTGSTLYQTPNLDKLASQGMKFTRGYAAAHVCSASRGAILTGRTPARLHYTIPGSSPEGAKLLAPQARKGIPSEEVVLPKLLKSQGYATAWFGKWHCGEGAKAAGFDEGNQDWNENNKNDPKDPKGVYTLNRQAMEFIGKNPGKPFFIALSHYAAHSPNRFDPAVAAKYQKIIDEKKIKGPRQKDAGYAAMIEALDDSVGKMLDFLDEKGLAKNTLVIFTSDNGGAVRFTKNNPLREGKGTLHEGGIRVPVLARWTDRIKPGTTNDTLLSGIDYLPTFASVIGAPAPEGIDGKDLNAALTKGETVDRGKLFWHFPHYHRKGPAGAIRDGDWKLIEWFEDGKTELFNLAQDVSEEKDLSGENPQKTAELLADLKTWREKSNAQMPTPNPKYDPSGKGGEAKSGEEEE